MTAVAAAIALRVGSSEDARRYLSMTHEELLSYDDKNRRYRPENTEWLTDAFRVPLALSRAVEYALDGMGGNDGEKYEKVLSFWRGLTEGKQKRYQRIFEYCGVDSFPNKVVH